MSQTTAEPAKTYRWGIIGPGRIAGKFAADLRHVPGAVRHSVFSRSSARGETFADESGFAQVHDDIAVFLTDEQLDIVYIATPHPAHFEQASQAIKAGKAVLIEKPITMKAAEARQLAALSQKHDVFVMEALWSRFLPAIQRARAIIDSGALGAIKRAKGMLHYHRPYDPDDRLFNPELGGGVMHDLGVYPLSVLRFLTGPLTLESANWTAAPSGVDSSAEMTLSANGTTVRVSVGFEANKADEGENSVVLYGSEKTLRLDRHFLRGDSLTLWDTPMDTAPSEKSFAGRAKKKLGIGGGRREAFERESTGLNFQAAAVQYALANGMIQHPVMPLSESAEVLAIIEAVLDPAHKSA